MCSRPRAGRGQRRSREGAMSSTPTDRVQDAASLETGDRNMQILLKHVSPEQIPASDHLYSAADLAAHLAALDEPPFSLIVVGDIMLGDHARQALKGGGIDYPFEAVLPLLRNASIVLGTLEGPLARKSARETRNYSYKVSPDLAAALARARVNVLTLANNHALDCGRDGILETLEALATAGVGVIGAGTDRRAAHQPLIPPGGGPPGGPPGGFLDQRFAPIDGLAGAPVATPPDM